MPKTNNLELLAPAGSPTALKAAVEAGADAVYMGATWTARARARNFTQEELAKAIAYCHVNNVKAYITLNTIIFEDELKPVAEYIRFIYEHGADAIIVQDLGVARIAIETGKDMAIHASTQMSVHNSKTARMLKDMGFTRAVLARELSIDQVKKIKENSGLEAEVFCHGALCYSYSGKCLWSYYQTKRSGNRGICSQLCRFPWKLQCKGKLTNMSYLTSTKDLNLSARVQDIADEGIDCIKIEGRLKDTVYVKEIVTAYRAAIDGKEIKPIKPTPRTYTTGYLFGEARKEKLTNPKAQRYAGEKIGRVMHVTEHGAIVKLSSKLKVGDIVRTSSSGRNVEVFRIYEKDIEVPESSGECLLKIKTLKSGDILFKLEKAVVDEEFLKAVQIKKSRESKPFKLEASKLDFSFPHLFFPENKSEIQSTRKDSACVVSWEDTDREALRTLSDIGAMAVIDTPRVVFDEEMPSVEKRMKELKDEGAFGFMVSEPSLVSDHITVVSHYANISNTLAAREWMKFGNVKAIISSIEVPYEKAKELGLSYFTGKNLELAISENNLFKEIGMPEDAGCELVDPKGNHFSFKIKNGRTVIMCPVKDSNKKKTK